MVVVLVCATLLLMVGFVGLGHFELSERERLNLHSTFVPRSMSSEKKTNTPPLTSTTRRWLLFEPTWSFSISPHLFLSNSSSYTETPSWCSQWFEPLRPKPKQIHRSDPISLYLPCPFRSQTVLFENEREVLLTFHVLDLGKKEQSVLPEI